MEAIDTFSETIRHNMVMSVVDKKGEDFTVNPKDLLLQVAQKL
jgi:hypothetical protein